MFPGISSLLLTRAIEAAWVPSDIPVVVRCSSVSVDHDVSSINLRNGQLELWRRTVKPQARRNTVAVGRAGRANNLANIFWGDRCMIFTGLGAPMRVRFSCVAFVPPGSQLGVSGSPEFLGHWDPSRCLPLLPYSAPAEKGLEPSLWFADVEVAGRSLEGSAVSPVVQSECASEQRNGPTSADDLFSGRLIAAVAKKYSSHKGSACIGSLPDMRCTTDDETSGVAAAAAFRIDHQSPEIIAILDSHPLKMVQFEYKFILWTQKNPVAPYVPDTPGESFHCVAYGSLFYTWRTWLFPPPPAQLTEPPSQAMQIMWEGSGPGSNRKFHFDPMDVIVDKCERGNLEVLYLCKIARFDDARGTPEAPAESTLICIGNSIS